MRRTHAAPLGGSSAIVSPIIVGCFGDTREGSTIAEACHGLGDVRRMDDRTMIVPGALRIGVALVLLPLVDPDGTPTAPLISRLLEAYVPAAVCLSPTAARAGLVQALQAGAQLLAWRSPAELREHLRDLVECGGMSGAERAALDSTLAFVASAPLRGLLTRCTLLAHRRLTVAALADSLSVSARTLRRETSRLHGPPPAELIAWGRALRISLTRWSGMYNPKSLVRTGGFSSSAAMLAAVRGRLAICGELEALTPLRVGRALERRLRSRDTTPW